MYSLILQVLIMSISKGDVRISTDSLQIGSNVSVVYTDTAKTQNYVFVNPASLDYVYLKG